MMASVHDCLPSMITMRLLLDLFIYSPDHFVPGLLFVSEYLILLQNCFLSYCANHLVCHDYLDTWYMVIPWSQYKTHPLIIGNGIQAIVLPKIFAVSQECGVALLYNNEYSDDADIITSDIDFLPFCVYVCIGLYINCSKTQ